MNKANSIINKSLLAGDIFMPELHLVDPIVKKFFKYRQVKLYLQKRS